MGQVYLAEDTKLGRQVAIKLLPPDDSAQPQSRKRLVKEAQAAAKLDHPHVCSIFEVGESASGAYIAMQFVEGETLGDLLHLRRPSIEEVAEWGAEVADALDEAHRQGLVHRDIKPQNIMITTKGHAKVLDFGLAKDVKALPISAKSATLLTSPGMVVGTVPYMSPEQVKGEDLDGRSDIFSLGAVLYEAATGRRPFTAKSGAELMSAILVSEPPMLLEGSSEMHPEMKRILKRCFAKEPSERYATAGALRDELRRFHASLLSGARFTAAKPPRKLPWKPIAMGAAVLAFAAVGAWGFSAWRDGASASDSVAVLPFQNASQDPQVDYLSDGLAEGLIDQLSHVRGLKVIAWTSASRYKSPNPDLKAIAKELGVKSVLVGRVLNRPNGLAVSVELASAEDGSHLWGEQYTRSADDLPKLQDSIAQGIAGALVGTKGADALLAQSQVKTTGSAYQLYLKGRFYADKWTPDEVNRGIAYFDQALQQDPNFALAHVGKAYAYWGLSSQFMAPSEAMPKVKAEAEAALKLNPGLAEAHTALAVAKAVYDHDFRGSEDEFQTALRLNPGSAASHEFYAYLLIGRNRYDDCAAQLDAARKLDPLSALLESFAGWSDLWLKKDTGAAMVHLQKAVELQPDFWWPYIFIAQAQAKDGHADLAAAALDKALAAGGSTFVLGERGFLAATRGDKAEANRLLQQLLGTQANGAYLSPMHPAMIYAALGDKANAMLWLNKAYEARDESCLILGVDPTWDSLRDDPAFKDLLARIDRGDRGDR